MLERKWNEFESECDMAEVLSVFLLARHLKLIMQVQAKKTEIYLFIL